MNEYFIIQNDKVIKDDKSHNLRDFFSKKECNYISKNKEMDGLKIINIDQNSKVVVKSNATNVRHDLKNFLNTIGGFAQILDHPTLLDAVQKMNDYIEKNIK